MGFDNKGDPASEDAHSVTVRLKVGGLAEFNKTGLRIQEILNLPPGSYQMKFALRDNSTSQIGTVILPAYKMK